MRKKIQFQVFPPTMETIREFLARLAPLGAMEVMTAGFSREGRAIPAVLLGEGPLAVSITAGAHSDEPAGPLAALSLVERILADADLRRAARWTILPHVNPDGAARNSVWFRPVPSLAEYLRHSFREPPGEDVEFNYPRADSPGDEAGQSPRPENLAVAEVLRSRGPFDLHLSLHGMAFAEGAWWLVGRKDVDRTGPLRRALADLFEARGFPLHDMERRGEKGFHRIEPGFCTTPDSVSMRRFFEERGDAGTARRFLPSSMEFVESLGGNPLVMVSELPLFLVGKGEYESVREALAPVREAHENGQGAALEEFARAFTIRPVPFTTTVGTLTEAVVKALRFAGESP